VSDLARAQGFACTPSSTSTTARTPRGGYAPFAFPTVNQPTAVLCGHWARRAPNGPFRRFSARAVSCIAPSLYFYMSPFHLLWNGVHLLISPAVSLAAGRKAILLPAAPSHRGLPKINAECPARR
jgi:hypothetical protein